MPLAQRVLGPFLTAVYTSRCQPKPDGSRPAFYRIATFIFASAEKMQEVMASPEGQGVIADLENFATGGHTFIMGAVDGQPESVPSAAATTARA